MTDRDPKPMLGRMATLLAAPFLLGRQALDLTWIRGAENQLEPPSDTPARISVTPPEHAIKRRG